MVDASLLAAAVFAEDDAPLAEAMLQGRALCAPTLVGIELANVAMNKVRRGLIAPGDAAGLLELVDALGIERFEVDPRAAFALAVRYRLSAYDAAYPWLAAHLDAPLATFDTRLGEASRLLLSRGGPQAL